MTIQLLHLDTKKAREDIWVSLCLESTEGEKIVGWERRAEGTFPKIVQQQKVHFRTTCFPRKILGMFFEAVFIWARFSRRRNFFWTPNSVVRKVRTVARKLSQSIQSVWHGFRGSELAEILTVKFLNSVNFAEHYGWDKFIFVFVVL